jgi:nicotinamidase-related amidase
VVLGIRTMDRPATEQRIVHVLIDMVNPLDFRGADLLAPRALHAAERIAAFKRRLRGAGIPTVYVNDNFGQWQVSFRELVEQYRHQPWPARLLQHVAPEPGDHFILKPMHSGFYGTSLDVLLGFWNARRLILTGVAGNICVLFTANDAHMRRYELSIPADCVASESDHDNSWALDQMDRVLGADIRPSTELGDGELR